MTSRETPPLIGRDAERQVIMSAFRASECAAVLIAGHAGVGKSRLAAEVASAIAANGRATAHVIATEAAAAVPFGPFASLLPDAETLAAGPLQFLQNASRAIADRARGGHSLLLVVDDAHLLDDGSAALVHQLVQNRSCGLVATVRTPDLAPDPIISLWKDGLALRVDVEALTRDETSQLAAAYLGGPVAGSALRWLWDVSAGNPLFARELLVGAEESKSVYAQDGIWFLRLPLPAPSRLTDLIASRLASIAPKTAEVVDLMAIGEPVGIDLLVGIVGHRAVEDAEKRGLMTVRDDGGRSQVRLSHPLYSEILRARIPRVRLRRLSMKLAEAHEATGVRRRDDVMRIARWRLDAGVPGNPELLEEAARQARAVRDVPLAARFARAAMAAGGGVTAGLVLGEAEFAAGRHQEAEKVFAGLVPLCHTDDERSAIANARAYNLGMLMGDQVAAAAVIEEALSAVEDPASRRRLIGRQIISDVWCGHLTAALRNADELLSSDDDLAVLRGSYACSVAQALLGRTEDAVATASRAVERHRRILQEHRPIAALSNYQPPEAQLVGAVIGHILGGRLAAADGDAQTAMEVALDTHDRESEATWSLLRGWVFLERGLLAEAVRNFREGVAVNRELSDMAPLRWCMAGVALADAMSGNAVAAARAEAELSALPSHWMVALDPHLVDRSRGWVLVASGQLTAGRQRLREAADAARSADQNAAEAFLLHDLVRLGDVETAAPRLRELTDVVDGDMVPAFAAHAAARVAGDASALEDAARRFEELGAMLLAAEAAHAAAVAYDAAGRTRQASALARECTRLAAVCGAERSPLLVSVDAAEQLTPRELEIAVLAASGLSSKEMADRLYVSVRTVDNHLQHVYSKLGISSRADLRAALRETER